MGHILLPNDRIGSRARNVILALQHVEVLCYNGLRFEFIKVCMGTQRFCRKNQFCLYFVNKIYLPCCGVVFFLFASSSGRSNAILASYRSVGVSTAKRKTLSRKTLSFSRGNPPNENTVAHKCTPNAKRHS